MQLNSCSSRLLFLTAPSLRGTFHPLCSTTSRDLIFKSDEVADFVQEIVFYGQHVVQESLLESRIAFDSSSEDGYDSKGLIEDNIVFDNVRDLSDNGTES